MYLAFVLLLKTVLGIHVFALAWGRSITEKSFVYGVVILQKLALKKNKLCHLVSVTLYIWDEYYKQ